MLLIDKLGPPTSVLQAPVPRWYTESMQEIFRLVRGQGVRMTFMIDDQANWASTLQQAKAQCEVMVKLLAALGFYLRPDKCQLRPAQRVKFLGLIADAAQLKFWVPQEKLDRLAAQAERLLQLGSQHSDRDLASVAGRLLSSSLAVDIAPLLARSLYHAMVGQGRWGELRETPEELRTTLRWCVDMTLRYNGSRMFKRAPSFILVGDASDIGAGGEP